MTLTVLPHVELIVLDYLRAQPDVVALVGQRTYYAIPPTPTWPLVVVTRLGGVASYPYWLDNARIQIDSWANDKPKARKVAATVAAALQQLPGVHGLGVVTAVDELGGLQYLPDVLYTPARPRYIEVVNVAVHPVS